MIRTALVDLIFQKATRLSSKERQQHRFPDGKVVNLLTNDSFRFERLPMHLWFVVSIPAFVAVILGFLIHLLGPGPALSGGAVLFIAPPLQGWVAALLRPWRAKLSAIADRRIDWTHQILRAMQVVKLFAWEPSFLRRVTELRSQEIVIVRRLLLARSAISTTSAMTPILASAASFVLYAALGNKLDATVVFPALAFFNSMRAQMVIWPTAVSTVMDCYVSMKRIEEFLVAEEARLLPEPDLSCQWAVDIQDGFFYWDQIHGDDGVSKNEKQNSRDKADIPSSRSADDTPPIALATDESDDPSRHVFLQDIQLKIPRGALVAVIGAVGHGKSSLLQAMVGNMPMHSGRLVRGEATSYAAQQPWIQNATVRDNILFGLPYDADRYSRVIRACQLERDMAALPHGDLTELGERGVNLSGGQKARISLARAVYFQPDIVSASTNGGESEKTLISTTKSSTVIMDDPLAAVDAHVGKRIWKECILTELQGRTRIVATHQLHVLPDVDLIVCMKDGRIEQVGSYQELMEDPHHDGFRKLVAEYGSTAPCATVPVTAAAHLKIARSDTAPQITLDVAPSDTSRKEVEDLRIPDSNDSGSSVFTGTTSSGSADTRNDGAKAGLVPIGKQTVKEERRYGAITLKMYMQMFRAVGLGHWCSVIGAYIFQQAIVIM
ncbi:hypothetical protein BGZ73_000657 [Actinomortierella ambigua]|nr:hypothetical protein BGZ73_000657 [Actinomortierella ambigua]